MSPDKIASNDYVLKNLLTSWIRKLEQRLGFGALNESVDRWQILAGI